MREFFQICDSFIAADEIESINGTSAKPGNVEKRAISIRTKSGANYNGELTPEEIGRMMQALTGATWTIQ